MKRLITFALMTTCLVISCSKFDDSAIWGKLNDHENRIAYLEEVCKKMNNDIVNLQTLVTALETNDYIVNASPLATGDGYTFIFKSGKSVVIYNGKDGKDGTDGKDGIDGKDGVTPTIGVMKDVDGVYYWTVNGEWLLVNGQKVKASAIDGKNGENGTNGTNGTDGVTPKFKIEDDYWYASYNNGQSWEKLGKATGNNGLDGINGEDGDSIFQKVIQDENCVYFYLADGTMITLRKHNTDIIQFEDLLVKSICCKNWDINYDGELSYDEASLVSVLTHDSGFSNNDNILSFTELKYFTNLEIIESSTFYSSSSLWKIAFPENLKEIGSYAFYECTSLLNIVIPTGVSIIGNQAFYGCSNIRTLRVDSVNLESVGSKAFYGCTGELSINCDIPSVAFNVNDFTAVYLGDNVSVIGERAFAGSEMKALNIGSNVLEISTEAFAYCQNLSKVIIPDKVITIGDRAFAYNRLSEITIGSSVESIGSEAFLFNRDMYFNPWQVSIYITRETPASLPTSNNAFRIDDFTSYPYPTSTYLKIYVPMSSVAAYKSQWTAYSDYITGYDF